MREVHVCERKELQGAMLVNLQARLLVVDAKHRLTAQQALQHPWMQVLLLFT